MKKKKAIRNYVLVSVCVVILLLLSIFSFSVPFTKYIFKGFVNGLNLGLDLGGGVSAVYEVEVADWYDGDLDDAINKAIDRVQSMLDKDYADAKVYKVDDDKIKIVLPDTTIATNYVVGLLEMKSESGEDAEAVVTGKDIKDCYYMYDSQNKVHGVYIEFTDRGKKHFEDLTSTVAGSSSTDGSGNNAGGTMYVYMDKNYDTPFSQPTVSEKISAGYTFISGAGITNKTTGEAYAEKFVSAKLGVNMSIIGEEIEVAPIYGDAAAVATFMIVVFFMLVVCGVFYLLYKELGFVQMLSFILSSLLTLVLLCVFDIQMTSFGAMGVLLGFALNVYLHMYYVNSVKSEYAMGKKLSVSVREGYTKSMALMIETLLISLGVSLVIFFIASGVVKAMAATFILSLIPTAFTALFINRVLVINYNAFNLNDGAKANFTRTKEVAQDETK